MNAAQLEELEAKANAALEYLHNRAEEHGAARAQAEYMEEWVKIELARLKGMMVGMSDAAATAEAMRHPDYHKAHVALQAAREAWYTISFKRAAKTAIFEAYRTACSNMRANV